jgi:hypothetical protein
LDGICSPVDASAGSYRGGTSGQGEMKSAEDLRTLAKNRRRTAGLARHAGSTLSVIADRLFMLQQAQELEAEASRLDAQAVAIEASGSN